MHLSSGLDTYQIARTPARSANGGLVVTPNFSASLHRALIIRLATQYKLPTVYCKPVLMR
jgi:hypothetical protein